MARVKRLLSSVLLAGGIVLVFTGLSASLGFTLPGILASIAAIAALLFAGGVWFGQPAVPIPAGAEAVVVFDRDLNVAAGLAAGTSVLLRFPEAVRPDVERRCRAALRGESSHFTCDIGGRRVVCDTAPVTAGSPLVLYGILITASGAAVPAVTPAPVATVA